MRRCRTDAGLLNNSGVTEAQRKQSFGLRSERKLQVSASVREEKESVRQGEAGGQLQDVHAANSPEKKEDLQS